VLERAYLVKSAVVNAPAYAALAGWGASYMANHAYFAGQVEVK